MESPKRTFKKGEVIFKEGDFEMYMYHLVRGSVGVYGGYGTADEKLLTLVNAGEHSFFGEIGLVEAMARSATAVAMEDVETIVIYGENFGAYFKDKPDALLAIMRSMSRRIRELTEDYMEACRAVAEAVETERSGAEKSGWFKEHLSKFMQVFKSSNS